jgi:hypothetical protein
MQKKDVTDDSKRNRYLRNLLSGNDGLLPKSRINLKICIF